MTARFETLASGYGLVEGPRVDDDNRLFFSDAREGGVYCRTPEGRVETVVPKRRGVGGIAIHADGGIVISGRDISHVREGASRTVFKADDAPGFNDLFTDSQGRVLVGSQKANPFEQDAKTVPGELYRIGKNGEVEELYGDVGLTNGIGFSPDGSRLYHSDSASGHIIGHAMTSDGLCMQRTVFATPKHGAPDGLAVDEEGGVWVALYGAGCVARYTPDGTLDQMLEIPALRVASLCFGGPDRRDLYITTGDNQEDRALRGSIFRTRVSVAGLPTPRARV